MTTKACLEDLIKYLAERGYLYEPKKCELIATLYRDGNEKMSLLPKRSEKELKK